MTVSEKALSDIFYSGTHGFKGDKSLIQKIHFLLKNDYLVCERVIMSSKTEFYQLCDSLKENPDFDDAAGGGNTHVALKLIAQTYLQKLGMNVIFEKQFYGYFPDVISIDLQNIVECGHTDNLDKIFTYFIQGSIAEVIQLPYPTTDDEFIFGYKFTAKNNLRGFLEAELDMNKDDILKILNRGRRI